jgi:hypothetical protein
MSVPEFHEAVFRWSVSYYFRLALPAHYRSRRPHPGANEVIVTGEFDAVSAIPLWAIRTAHALSAWPIVVSIASPSPHRLWQVRGQG